ncbi:Vesicle coat complex COPI, epsilon subunit [Phaffia rhodozyma]|uniref:Coatomer subunit epsilon n=1 Tax=Phaffia rhodozyma TaxID=264483 RepID=A0A0F7SEH7_PHARH|nr:Vesicle coat complex COPI, epsilon subunit [Phaffia rhodozyma]
MDSDQLFHIKHLFHQGNFNQCITTGTPLIESGPDSTSVALYVARSHLALLPPATDAAIDILSRSPDPEAPEIKAFSFLASYIQDPQEEPLDGLRDLLIELEDGEQEESTDNAVRVAAGTAFFRAAEKEEAVDALNAHKDSLECSALLVQIYLSIDRLDLAKRAYEHAKAFGEDSQLVQLMDSWITLRSQGPTLQQAYYFYDETLLAPTGRTAPILAAHGAAHHLLGHKEEAEGDVNAALEVANEQTGEAGAIATAAGVLGTQAVLDQLKSVYPSHPLVLDLAAKDLAFDEAAAKFAVFV